jgi:para-aminobenzoate synthetase component 1
MQIDAKTLHAKMNELGSRLEPFVFAVDYNMQRCLFFENPLDCTEIRWATEEANNGTTDLSEDDTLPRLEIKRRLSFDEYAHKFDIIQRGLTHGDSFLANLTVGVEVECNCSFEDVYNKCDARYKLLIPNEFVCFSPERFIRVLDNRIYTYPMKGTIDATVANAEGLLMNSYKEKCEHNTIVDLLRNDLSMVSEDVSVNRYRYIDRIKTQSGEILQTSSEIVGNLADNWHNQIGDIIFKLLPAGSICGAPKPATLKLIAEAEQLPRGWYTGVWGYYDGKTLDTAVMIRCLAERDGKTYFHSGGGITINSSVEDEYDEVLQKIYLPIR